MIQQYLSHGVFLLSTNTTDQWEVIGVGELSDAAVAVLAALLLDITERNDDHDHDDNDDAN